MPKRRAVKQLIKEESDLSPPPEVLPNDATAEVNVKVNDASPGKKRKIKAEVVQEVQATGPGESLKTGKRKVKVEEEAEADDVEAGVEKTPESKPKRRTKKEAKVEEKVEEKGEVVEKPVKKKRQPKAEKEAEMIANPLAARTVGHKLFIGAHVSSAGGLLHKNILRRVYMLNVHRCPQRAPKQRAHRRKRLCSLFEEPA